MLKIIAAVLIVGGLIGLVYGGFNYPTETHSLDVGKMHLQVNQTRRVSIPLWVGLGALVGGLVLLASARKR